jgi:hypothetical protein
MGQGSQIRALFAIKAASGQCFVLKFDGARLLLVASRPKVLTIADHFGWRSFVFRLEGVIRTPNSKMYIGVLQRNFGPLGREFVKRELDDVSQAQAMLNQRLKREDFLVSLPNCQDYSHRPLRAYRRA